MKAWDPHTPGSCWTYIFEVSRTLAYKFGLQIPNQFNLFNIPIGALGLTLAGGQSIQDVINQLIASGGINQANSTGLAALLAQLTGGNASIQPVATFGGGMTRLGSLWERSVPNSRVMKASCVHCNTSWCGLIKVKMRR